MITVAWKLAQSEHLPLSSLAEELAALAIIQEAKGHLEDRKNAFDTFIDRYFEDTDVAFLFDDRYDGLDETEVAQMLGLSSLAFASSHVGYKGYCRFGLLLPQVDDHPPRPMSDSNEAESIPGRSQLTMPGCSPWRIIVPRMEERTIIKRAASGTIWRKSIACFC